MRDKNRCSLNSANLAIIGALDDFYDVYIQIQNIYNNQRDMFTTNHGEKRTLWPDTWDNMCKKDVRAVCEPLMNRYLPVFVDGHSRIFANAHGFAAFSFLRIKSNDRTTHPIHVKIQMISFEEFLAEFQFAVTRIIHRRIIRDLPKYDFERLFEEVNNHIVSYAQEKNLVQICPAENLEQTNEVLYIYENLQSIACSKYGHNIEVSTFVADFAMGSGKIVLPVHFCVQCKKYFIGRITLSLFENTYGKLLIRKRQYSENADKYADLNEESLLHQLGYNVSDGRTDMERQRLLVTLLNKQKITYLDIVKTIESNIRLSGHKPQAVTKWKRDLTGLEYGLLFSRN